MLIIGNAFFKVFLNYKNLIFDVYKYSFKGKYKKNRHQTAYKLSNGHTERSVIISLHRVQENTYGLGCPSEKNVSPH